MKKIESFTVDHTKLLPGIYISRVDGDITTYDLRMKRPNAEPVLDNPDLHTIEHLFATYVRNSRWSEHVIYFGPMGCRTGFYFLVRDMLPEDVIALTGQAFRFIQDYEGVIPGSSEEECGNYRDHDLDLAMVEAKKYLDIIAALNKNDLNYEK